MGFRWLRQQVGLVCLLILAGQACSSESSEEVGDLPAQPGPSDAVVDASLPGAPLQHERHRRRHRRRPLTREQFAEQQAYARLLRLDLRREAQDRADTSYDLDSARAVAKAC